VQVTGAVPPVVKWIAAVVLVVLLSLSVMSTEAAVPLMIVTESLPEPKAFVQVTVMTFDPSVSATESPEVIELDGPPLSLTEQVTGAVPPVVKLIAADEAVVLPPVVVMWTEAAVPLVKVTVSLAEPKSFEQVTVMTFVPSLRETESPEVIEPEPPALLL
jgi:hypothetical protein